MNTLGRCLLRRCVSVSEVSSPFNALVGQKRNQCKYDDDNARSRKEYDENESLFSDTQLSHLKSLFLKFDRDDNCKLDRWEFNMLAKELVGRSYNAVDLEKVYKEIDNKNTGTITYAQLMRHLGRQFAPQEKQRITMAFNAFDKDSDGHLEYWETKQAILFLGEDILAKQLRYKFDLIDTDQDGKIKYSEFCKFICCALRGKE